MSSVCVFLMAVLLHAHHSSICELKYQPDKHTIELTQQVFADDLESYLKRHTGDQTFDIRKKSSSNTLVLQHFAKEHLCIKIDEHELEQNWIGYKLEGNYVRFFVEFLHVTGTKLSITSTIFLDMLVGQENIVHFEKNGERSTAVISQKKQTVYFDL